MTVGVVLVSHSAAIAAGARELAAQMSPGVPIAATGGDEDGGLGTSLDEILKALERADQGEGLVVLYDLGGAELTAQTALEFGDPETQERRLLCDAPLVEGALAAATTAAGGADVHQVAAAARAAGAGAGPDAAPASPDAAVEGEPDARRTVTLVNPLGLHARPAAMLARELHDVRAEVRVRTPEQEGVSARSLLAMVGLGATRGAELVIEGWGPDAERAVERIAALARDGFGEADHEAQEPGDAPAPAGPATADGDRAAGPDAAPLVAGASRRGVPVVGGLAIGPAARLDAALPEPEESEHDPEDGPPKGGADPDGERGRLEAAVARVRGELEALARGPEGEIFAAHELLLDDPALHDAVRARLDAGTGAARAWRDAVAAQHERLAALEGEALAARAADVLDVGRRVLRELGVPAAAPDVPEGAVVVADDVLPSQVPALVDAGVGGLALGRGAPTSHAMILARAAGVPAVTGLGPGVADLAEGTMIVVDGDAGELTVDPEAGALEAARARLACQEEERQERLAAAQEPARLADGTRVEVAANAARPAEAAMAATAGAEGIGLLRTEMAFLERTDLPDEDEQARDLAAVCEAIAPARVIVRTLDAGGDKPLPALDLDPVRHGFLGQRGLRHGLAHPAVLATQLRAILRVAAEHRVAVMFPMVSDASELRAARAALAEAAADLDARGQARGWPEEVGVMVEVPAAAVAADHLAPEVDFFSVGTNDLVQYALAVDRTLPEVAHLARPDHPAVVRLVRQLCEAAEEAGCWVGVCGDAAADPHVATVLVGAGVRELSVAPAAVPAVKAALRAVDLAEARARLAAATAGP